MRLLLHILHVKVCMFRTFFSVEPLCLRINTWLSKVDRKRTSRVFNPSIPKMKLVLCFSFMCKESITIVDRVTITAGILGIMTSLSLSLCTCHSILLLWWSHLDRSFEQKHLALPSLGIRTPLRTSAGSYLVQLLKTLTASSTMQAPNSFHSSWRNAMPHVGPPTGKDRLLTTPFFGGFLGSAPSRVFCCPKNNIFHSCCDSTWMSG